jgi:DNA-binding MarR family transcriptional regulator
MRLNNLDLMKLGGRKINLMGVLRLADDFGEQFFPMTRNGAYRLAYQGLSLDLDDYFPSEIERSVDRLERRGWVKKISTNEGTRVEITDEGKKQILLFDLESLKPKSGKWDGNWRMVFFDIPEVNNRKRQQLRRYLQKLGFWKMQESVWICPYNCEAEVRYIREILEIPHEVKLGTLEKIENELELKRKFNLK